MEEETSYVEIPNAGWERCHRKCCIKSRNPQTRRFAAHWHRLTPSAVVLPFPQPPAPPSSFWARLWAWLRQPAGPGLGDGI